MVDKIKEVVTAEMDTIMYVQQWIQKPVIYIPKSLRESVSSATLKMNDTTYLFIFIVCIKINVYSIFIWVLYIIFIVSELSHLFLPHYLFSHHKTAPICRYK